MLKIISVNLLANERWYTSVLFYEFKLLLFSFYASKIEILVLAFQSLLENQNLKYTDIYNYR